MPAARRYIVALRHRGVSTPVGLVDRTEMLHVHAYSAADAVRQVEVGHSAGKCEHRIQRIACEIAFVGPAARFSELQEARVVCVGALRTTMRNCLADGGLTMRQEDWQAMAAAVANLEKLEIDDMVEPG